jgi:hypothetical protein
MILVGPLGVTVGVGLGVEKSGVAEGLAEGLGVGDGFWARTPRGAITNPAIAMRNMLMATIKANWRLR